MGKGSSGKKANAAAKRNRARYKIENRLARNKRRKAVREEKKLAKRARRLAERIARGGVDVDLVVKGEGNDS